jgi:phosphate starvation-inducible membrane PsiE
MPKDKMTRYTTALLALAIFFERYCFIVTVYKTKYYGYVLILIVIAMNCVFNFIITRIKPKKGASQKHMHEVFNLARTPSVGLCSIIAIG